MSAEPRMEVGDLCARKAGDALARLKSGNKLHVKRTREEWRDYGAALIVKRSEFTSDKLFGQWITDNQLNTHPANTQSVRSDAMWLAEYWQEVEKFYSTFESRVEHLHRPNNIRQACRKAGCEWAFAKPKEPKDTVGWVEGVRKALGGKLPEGFGRNQLQYVKRPMIEAELGRTVPSRVQMAEAQEIAAIVQRLADQRHPDAARLRVSNAQTEVTAEALTLSETAQAKFDRLLAKATKTLQDSYQLQLDAAVKAEVDKRLEVERKWYEERTKEATEEITQYAARSKSLDHWMTETEFKLVLGCLHPDRQSESERAKYDKAFQIFKRLEQHLEPNSAKRMSKGWT